MVSLRILLLLLIATAIFVFPAFSQKNTLLNGTIIISLTSQDTIWLGADSRTSALTEKGYTANKQGMCKIHSTNNVVYAMAGHVRYADNSFNFLDIMDGCVKEEDDFERSMKLFEERAKKEIGLILKKFSRKSINTLIKTNKGSFLSVVAVSFVNGEKKMKEMRFSIETAGKNSFNVLYKANDENGVGSLRFIGHAENASRYIRDNNLFFGNGRNIPDKINELIRLESTASETVGMPADVVTIYNNGFKRVITSGLCP